MHHRIRIRTRENVEGRRSKVEKHAGELRNHFMLQSTSTVQSIAGAARDACAATTKLFRSRHHLRACGRLCLSRRPPQGTALLLPCPAFLYSVENEVVDPLRVRPRAVEVRRGVTDAILVHPFVNDREHGRDGDEDDAQAHCPRRLEAVRPRLAGEAPVPRRVFEWFAEKFRQKLGRLVQRRPRGSGRHGLARRVRAPSRAFA